jgi:hypothetical protein
LVGYFCTGEGVKRLVSLPEFNYAPVAGFYTTRVVEASTPAAAAELAADSIQRELIESIGEESSACSLEVESCEMIEEDDDTSPTKGFTFFMRD